MNEVYVIEFESESHKIGDYDNVTKEHRVFGVAETELQGIYYLRRFLNEGDDMDYKGQTLKIVERKGAYTYAEAWRQYDCDNRHFVETLHMRPMEIGKLRAPEVEILDTYC